MTIYKRAYVVTTNTGNEFMIKQKEPLGVLIIDAFNVFPDRPSKVSREEFFSLKDLHIALLALGVSKEVLLPVYISVLAMIGLDVYSVYEMVQSCPSN